MPSNPYQCPITLSTMKDPVLAPDGYSYERTAITSWLQEHGTSPQTREPMLIRELVPNRALLEIIEQQKLDPSAQMRPSVEVSGTQATKVAEAAAAPEKGSNNSSLKKSVGPDVQKITAATEHAARYSPEILEQTLMNSTGATLFLNESSTKTTARLNITTPDVSKAEVKQSLTTPVHICCVVDISGSMDEPAICKDENGAENDDVGLSILDVVKFAVTVTAESLNPQDKLSIVTYSDFSAVVLEPTCMDSYGKKKVVEKLAEVKPKMRTNLYAGLQEGVQLSNSLGCNYISSVFVLTDGLPNIHPPLGYGRSVAKLIHKFPIHGSLSTFGFGYNLDSNLLVDIAKIGGGYFSFIPDSGLTGTCFINAMANARCIFGAQPKLRIYHGDVNKDDLEAKKLKPKKGGFGGLFGRSKKSDDDDDEVIERPEFPPTLDELLDGTMVTHTEKKKKKQPVITRGKTTIVHLSPLRYGGNMDVLIRPELVDRNTKIDLVFEIVAGKKIVIPVTTYAEDDDDESKSYHKARVKFAKNLMQVASGIYDEKRAHTFVPKKGESDEPRMAALLEDMNGQATTAISKEEYFRTWGKHYLKSLACAHLHQFCNNFKDPGVQVYGEGALFQSLQEELDDIFEKVPPPKPSRILRRGAPKGSITSMAKTFNNRKAICVHGKTLLKIKSADGIFSTPISNIKKGDQVLTSTGGFAKVECLVQTCAEDNSPFDLVKVGNLLVTPHHPVKFGGRWEFPINIPNSQFTTNVSDDNAAFAVYNLVLEEGQRRNSILMDGIETITLGHGVVDNAVLKHAYFGTNAVISDLCKLGSWDRGIVVIAESDVQRDNITGNINHISLVKQIAIGI